MGCNFVPSDGGVCLCAFLFAHYQLATVQQPSAAELALDSVLWFYTGGVALVV